MLRTEQNLSLSLSPGFQMSLWLLIFLALASMSYGLTLLSTENPVSDHSCPLNFDVLREVAGVRSILIDDELRSNANRLQVSGAKSISESCSIHKRIPQTIREIHVMAMKISLLHKRQGGSTILTSRAVPESLVTQTAYSLQFASRN